MLIYGIYNRSYNVLKFKIHSNIPDNSKMQGRFRNSEELYICDRMLKCVIL